MVLEGIMAEGEGFEPPLDFRPKRFSRPPVSTTHTSLRGGLWGFGFIVTGPAGSGRAACGVSASGFPHGGDDLRPGLCAHCIEDAALASNGTG